MKAPRWDHNEHPGDVVRQAEYEARCALAALVAIETLRNDTDVEYIDWHEGTAADMLGTFDNLLACARALADQRQTLVDYIRQETDTLVAGWEVECVKRRAAREAEHPTEEPAPT